MPISECSVITDGSGRELTEHGTREFPVGCYHDDFRILDVPWHWHTELEAAVVTEGSCVVAAGNEKYRLRRGDGFFVNSGVLHGCWDPDATGCRFHSLVFDPNLVGGEGSSVFRRKYIDPLIACPGLEMLCLRPEEPWQARALEAVETAWMNCSLGAPGFEFRVRSSLSELVFLLTEHLPQIPGTVRGKDRRDTERIKIMLDYIHKNYPSELTARDIAESAMVSQSECLRCFRSTVGTTPVRYLNQYRIHQAARLLVDTDARVSEIAVECGFQDMSYFTKMFRREKGCVPTRYREQEKNTPPEI